MNTSVQSELAQQHASAAPLSRNQYPALLARIDALEAAVGRLTAVIEKLAAQQVAEAREDREGAAAS